jgi:predicted amidohydrolase
MTITVACVQLNSGQDMAANLASAERLIRAAHGKGARFIATPENTPLMEHRREVQRSQALPLAQHLAVGAFSALAAELECWLLLGSLSTPSPHGKLANRSLLFDPKGEIAASYDKVHMFDVEIGDGARYQESASFESGTQAVLAPTPFGTLGLSVCYDLRFAHLYRLLAQAGAEILTIPAAFTKLTGAAHWHTLVRARAIETGSFVIAPAQCGSHSGNRQTFGHSLIVAPWGEVLADGGEEVGFITAVLVRERVAEARRMIPALQHDRPIAPPIGSADAAKRARS